MYSRVSQFYISTSEQNTKRVVVMVSRFGDNLWQRELQTKYCDQLTYISQCVSSTYCSNFASMFIFINNIHPSNVKYCLNKNLSNIYKRNGRWCLFLIWKSLIWVHPLSLCLVSSLLIRYIIDLSLSSNSLW